MEKSEFMRILAVLIKKYGDRVPEFREIWNSGGNSNLDPVVEISTLIKKYELLAGVMPDLKIPVSNLVLDQDGKKSLVEVLGEHDITTDELVYERVTEKGTVLPTINPLYIAALAEKNQFDGDTPELRIGGDLPEGADPAVPVDTDAISFVAVGAQLEQAKQEVKDQLETVRQERIQKFDDALLRLLGATGDTTTALVKSVEDAIAEVVKPLNVEGYEGGKLPVHKKIQPLTGAALLALSSKDRKKLAWGALSTTQGRKSSVPVMGKILEERLQSRNLDVTYVTGWSEKEAITEGRWVVKIHGDNINPNFDTVNIAVLSLLRQLGKELEIEAPLEVEVKPINLYSMREVGWRAQVVYKNPPKKLYSAEEDLQSRIEGG